MIESERGCGYRKEGLYLIGIGRSIPCDRLVFPIDYCKTCGAGLKFTRGVQWLNWYRFAGMHKTGIFKTGCNCREACPICYPKENEMMALMWTGAKFYTTQSFIDEATKLGVCKRIATIPRGLQLNKTWIMLAHKQAITLTPPVINDKGKVIKKGKYQAGIFYCFMPTRIEKIVSTTSAKKKRKMEALQKKGITILVATEVDSEGNVKETEIWNYWYQNYLEERK